VNAKQIAKVDFYVTDFGDVKIPEPAPVAMTFNHWPDRRFKLGRIYQLYLNHISDLARQAWERGENTRLIAPPFSEWFRRERNAGRLI